MKHDVNQLLLGLLFMACFSMAVLVIYYNLSFDRLNDSYYASLGELENKSDMLEMTIQDIQQQKALLVKKEDTIQQYLDELNLSKRRESSLGEHFQDIKSQNDLLSENLDATSADRDRWIDSYNDMKDDRDSCKSDLVSKNRQLSTTKTKVSQIESQATIAKNKVDDMKNSLENLAFEIDELQTYSNGITNSTIRNNVDDFVDSLTSDKEDLKSYIEAVEADIDKVADDLLALKNG